MLDVLEDVTTGEGRTDDVDLLPELAEAVIRKVEEHLALVSGDWQTGTYTGDFSADGYPDSRFLVVRSDAAVNGGIPDELMAVTATTWNDSDGDQAADADEPAVVFGSKLAKLSSYP